MPSSEHPTVKPVALIERLIRNSSRQGAVVLAFAGSGSTLVACQMTGRRGYGVEIDPAYCDGIADRIMAAASSTFPKMARATAFSAVPSEADNRA